MMRKLAPRNVLHVGNKMRILRSVFPKYQLHFSTIAWNGVKTSPSRNLRCISNQLAGFSTRVEVNPETVSVTTNYQSECIQLFWKGHETHQYPYLWLRDNCQCPNCYNASSMSRRLLMRDLDPKSAPAEIKVNEEAEMVHIRWNDGHESTFTFDWLKTRSFSSEVRTSRLEWMRSTKRNLWNNADMQDKLPTVKFEQLIKDDKALYDWITTIEETGVILVVDTPQRNGEVLKLAERVAFLRKTNYGESFQVKAKFDPSNQGYTPDSLGLHTDLAYYWNPPYVSCLHCISQAPTRGGESELTDGFYIAELMRKEYPEHFKILTTVPVDFYDEGTDYYKFYNMTKHLTISLNKNDEVERIIYNNPVRDTFLTVPVEQVQPLYKALRLFDSLLYDPANVVKFKMTPGNMMCLQNVRVLHGRTGYEILEKGNREVEGGHLDWEELLSRRRVIACELGLNK